MTALRELQFIDTKRAVPRRRHAENPDQPGHALCGAKLANEIRMGDGDCPLCLAVINGTRDWGTR